MQNVDQTILSQYSNAATIVQLVHNLDGYIDPSADINAFYDNMWNVDTAVGKGLDNWGKIVGLPNGRLLKIPDGEINLGFSEAGKLSATPFGSGVFYSGATVTQNFYLEDDAFRTLIMVKALANITDCSIPSYNRLLQLLFAGRGRCYVNDLGNMQMRYTFEFYLQPFEIAIITQSGVLPRPTGVLASMVQIPNGSTFGFVEQGIGRVTPVGTPLVYRNDWQGNNLMYTTPRSNMAIQSSNLLSGSWSQTRVSSIVAATGPDGSKNAATITSASSGGAAYLFQSFNFVAGQSYQAFAVAKAGTSNVVTIQSFTQPGVCSFTLSGTGSIGAPSGIASNPWIVALAGGWYMFGCTLTATATAANNVSATVVPTAASTVTFFGPQIGSSGIYIPTTTTARTVTDYIVSGNDIVVPSPLPVGASLAWTGSYTSLILDQIVSVTQQPTGAGDGATTVFPFSGRFTGLGAQPFGQGTFFTGALNAS